MKDFAKLFSKKYILSIIGLSKYLFLNQYKGSYLGFAWSLILPTIYIGVMSAVFSIIMRFPINNFVVHLAPGLITWNFFVNSLTSGSSALLKRESILKKVIIPKTIFPISETILHLINFVLSFLSIVVIIKVVIGGGFNLSILLLPIAAFPVILTSVTVAIMLAYITPYFRDITHLITVAFTVLFWTVPVAYPLEIIPESKRIFFEMNPLYALIQPVQYLVYNGQFINMNKFIYSLSVSILASLISYYAYKKLHRRVIYYI